MEPASADGLHEPLVDGIIRSVTNVALHAGEAPTYEAVDEYWHEAATALPSSAEFKAPQNRLAGARLLMLTDPLVHVDPGRRHRINPMFLLTRRPS